MSDVLVAANALGIALVAGFALAAPAGVFAAPKDPPHPSEALQCEQPRPTTERTTTVEPFAEEAAGSKVHQ